MTYRANGTNRSGSDQLPYAERLQAQIMAYPLEISPLLPEPPEEQAALLTVLDSDRFADKSPAQVYAIFGSWDYLSGN